MDPNLCEEVEWRPGADGMEPDFVHLSMCERRAKLSVEELLAFEAFAKIRDAERRVEQAQRVYRDVKNKIEDIEQELADSSNGLFVVSLAAEGTCTAKPELLRKAQEEVLRFHNQYKVASQKRAQLEAHSDDASLVLRNAIASLDDAREHEKIHRDAAKELRSYVKESERILKVHQSYAKSNPSRAVMENKKKNCTQMIKNDVGTTHSPNVSDTTSFTKNVKLSSTHQTSQKDHDDALEALSSKMDTFPRKI